MKRTFVTTQAAAMIPVGNEISIEKLPLPDMDILAMAVNVHHYSTD